MVDGFVVKPKPFTKHANYEIGEAIQMQISWDTDLDEIIFQVEMPNDAYLAVAFGSNLENCDMLLFQSEKNKERIQDCFLEGDDPEFLDLHQDWMSEIVDYGSRHNKLFTARRALDTEDLQDFAFQLDREMTIGFQYSTDTSNFDMHEIMNKSTLLLLSDG